MIRRALHSPDHRASVENLKGARRTYRKVFTGVWSQLTASKTVQIWRKFCLQTSKSDGGQFLPRRIFCMRRMITIRRALHSSDLWAPVRHLKDGCSTYRKFFRDTWSQLTVWNQSKFRAEGASKVKIRRRSVFAAPNFLYASYDHDSTCATFPWSWGTC